MSALLDLQYYQYLHDERYHKDIAVLTPVRRLSHLTSHLVKYTSNLPSDTYYEDTYAVLLSMANVMRLDLGKACSTDGHRVTTIEQLKPKFHDERVDELISTYIKQLSKAIESWDHLEKYDYRNKIEEAITELFILNFQKFLMEVNDNPLFEKGWDPAYILATNWFNRLEKIKKAHMFHKHFHLELLHGHAIYVLLRKEWGIK